MAPNYNIKKRIYIMSDMKVRKRYLHKLVHKCRHAERTTTKA